MILANLANLMVMVILANLTIRANLAIQANLVLLGEAGDFDKSGGSGESSDGSVLNASVERGCCEL